MAVLEKNLNKNDEDIKTASRKSRGYIKKRIFLVVIMQVFSCKGLI